MVPSLRYSRSPNRYKKKFEKFRKLIGNVSFSLSHLVEVLSDVDAVVDDSAELFTMGFSTIFGFGGRPFGLGGGFVVLVVLETFAFTSSSDSVVLSGEKMLFSLEFTFLATGVFGVTFGTAPVLLNKFLF